VAHRASGRSIERAARLCRTPPVAALQLGAGTLISSGHELGKCCQSYQQSAPDHDRGDLAAMGSSMAELQLIPRCLTASGMNIARAVVSCFIASRPGARINQSERISGIVLTGEHSMGYNASVGDSGERSRRYVGTLAKLYERAKRNPGSVSFDELNTLLARWGFARRQPHGGSSHYFYTRGTVTLSVPRGGKAVKPVYVRRVMKALEQLGLEEEP
jgi:hypothetical protein